MVEEYAQPGPGGAMRLDEFVGANSQQDRGAPWQLENPRTLEVRVDGQPAFIRGGSMIAYYGDLAFTRAGAGSIEKLAKKVLTGEVGAVTEVTGRGVMYVGHEARRVHLIELRGEGIHVNGRNFLAYSASLAWDIEVIPNPAVLAAGLFNLRLSGMGMAAITTRGDALVLRVTPEYPLRTSPHATVAWSRGLTPELRADVNWKTLVGMSSGETFQLDFQGDGFVIVQPDETVAPAPAAT